MKKVLLASVAVFAMAPAFAADISGVVSAQSAITAATASLNGNVAVNALLADDLSALVAAHGDASYTPASVTNDGGVVTVTTASVTYTDNLSAIETAKSDLMVSVNQSFYGADSAPSDLSGFAVDGTNDGKGLVGEQLDEVFTRVGALNSALEALAAADVSDSDYATVASAVSSAAGVLDTEAADLTAGISSAGTSVSEIALIAPIAAPDDIEATTTTY